MLPTLAENTLKIGPIIWQDLAATTKFDVSALSTFSENLLGIGHCCGFVPSIKFGSFAYNFLRDRFGCLYFNTLSFVDEVHCTGPQLIFAWMVMLAAHILRMLGNFSAPEGHAAVGLNMMVNGPSDCGGGWKIYARHKSKLLNDTPLTSLYVSQGFTLIVLEERLVWI